jgi:DNA-binding transcriptional MerR regulator
MEAPLTGGKPRPVRRARGGTLYAQMADTDAKAGAEEVRDPQRVELLTIEDLAARTGMTVRNIRSHRTAGLLPAPIVRDRVGYYGPEHVTRLELIRELQAEGFNLRGIKQLIEQPRLIPSEVLTLKHLLDSSAGDEKPQLFTREDLARRFHAEDPAKALAQATSLGLLQEVEGGYFEAPVPSLLDIAEQVVAQGVPIADALAVLGKVQQHCQATARAFVELFLRDVWSPFVARDYPEEEWNTIVEAIERLRPQSSRVLLAIYELVMAREVENAFGRELERLSKTRGKGGRKTRAGSRKPRRGPRRSTGRAVP